MSEMIEQVAKAMARNHWLDDSRYKSYLSTAKAAIAAMREPTKEMLEFGCNSVPIDVWQAMIDEALK